MDLSGLRAKVTLTVVLLSLPLAGWTLSPQQYDLDTQLEELAAFLPDGEGDGKMLIMAYCTGCHSPAEVKNLIETRTGRDKTAWMNLISWMIGIKNAPIAPEDREPIADYLTEHFGPLSLSSSGTILSAVAKLAPTPGGTAQGNAIFQQLGNEVKVTLEMHGLSPGGYAVAIEKGADCSTMGTVDDRAATGELATFQADTSGQAHLQTSTTRFTLSAGPNSVEGETVIVYAHRHSYANPSAANVGKVVVCGVVKLE